MKETITYEQIEAIKMAYESSDWNRYFLDIKLSPPIPTIRLYLIFLVGRDCHSQRRLRYPKGGYPLRNPINVLFFLGIVIIFLISSFAIITFVFSSISSRTGSPYPTSIPWINNQFDCERTQRIWSDDQCWDLEHSPLF